MRERAVAAAGSEQYGHLVGGRREVVQHRGDGLPQRRRQGVRLLQDVLRHARAAQELRHLVAEVVAVVLQESIFCAPVTPLCVRYTKSNLLIKLCSSAT